MPQRGRSQRLAWLVTTLAIAAFLYLFLRDIGSAYRVGPPFRVRVMMTLHARHAASPEEIVRGLLVAVGSVAGATLRVVAEGEAVDDRERRIRNTEALSLFRALVREFPGVAFLSAGEGDDDPTELVLRAPERGDVRPWLRQAARRVRDARKKKEYDPPESN